MLSLLPQDCTPRWVGPFTKGVWQCRLIFSHGGCGWLRSRGTGTLLPHLNSHSTSSRLEFAPGPPEDQVQGCLHAEQGKLWYLSSIAELRYFSKTHRIYTLSITFWSKLLKFVSHFVRNTSLPHQTYSCWCIFSEHLRAFSICYTGKFHPRVAISIFRFFAI